MNKNEKKNESHRNILDTLNDSFLKENKVIFKKYKPLQKIGKGAFGKIYSTIRLEDKNVFAMKTERKNALRKMLETEAYFLILLQGFGIPKLISFGHTKNYNILIETLLGKTLHDIFIKAKKTCDIKNMCLIALQLIERLEFIHSKNIVYRDVKPENFLIGIKDPNVLYIVDFGLCKKYRSSKTGKHLLPRDTKKFNGTLKYSSVNVVKGKESSRRDDLISLGYVLILLYKRYLPWTSDFKSLNKKTYIELIKSKETNAGGDLFKNVPKELEDYLKYCEKLKFEEDPNYNHMKGFFQTILNRLNFNINKLNFCWINPNDKNIKALPRNFSWRKSSPSYRLLKHLERERLKSSQLNSFDGKSYIKNTDKIKDIINNKKHFISDDFGKLNYNSNNNTENSLKEKNNNNIAKTENNIKKKNDYLKDGKMIIKKMNVKNFIYIRDKINKIKYLHKPNNSFINENKMKLNKNLIPHKNIYINNNNNIFFKFETPKNNISNNGITHRKINSQMVFNDYNKKKYMTKITNFNKINDYKFSLNTTSNINNSLNNKKFKHIKYDSIFSLEQTNDNLYNLYNNNSKVYKSKIKKETLEYNNDILSNGENYSYKKKNNGKNSKIHKIPVPKPYKLNYIYE